MILLVKSNEYSGYTLPAPSTSKNSENPREEIQEIYSILIDDSPG